LSWQWVFFVEGLAVLLSGRAKMMQKQVKPAYAGFTCEDGALWDVFLIIF
jgi:hypothetical protein